MTGKKLDSAALPQHFEVHWADQNLGTFSECYADLEQATARQQQLIDEGHRKATLITVTDYRSVKPEPAKDELKFEPKPEPAGEVESPAHHGGRRRHE